MRSFNKIIIAGHLGRDPEIRYLPDGTAVCNFSVATSEKRKDRSGEGQETTTWFKVVLWRQLAELANQYLTKGKPIYIEGRLTQQEYTDKDGNKRTSLEVTATEMKFLDSKGDESSSSYQSSAPASRPATSAPPDGGNEEDIPF
jgi:single-strand DNA-binding protein